MLGAVKQAVHGQAGVVNIAVNCDDNLIGVLAGEDKEVVAVGRHVIAD